MKSSALLTGGALLMAAGVVCGQSPAPRPASTAPKATGLITGQVVNGETGSPVSGVVVAISGTGPGAGRLDSSARVLTDAQGRFFFEDLAPGSYSLAGTKGGWIPGAFGRRRPGGSSQPINLKEDERRGGLTIPMWRFGVIAGRALDEQGEPLVGADVRVFQRTFAAGHPQLGFITRAITDDRGAFRVANLLPGDYVVMVPATVKTEPAGMGAEAGQPNSYLQTMTAIGAAPMSLDRAEVASRSDEPRVSSILNLVSPPSADGVWTTYATTLFPSATSVAAATVVHVVAGRERAGVDIFVRLVPTFRVSGTLVDPDGAPAALHAIHLLPADSSDHPIFDVATAVTDGAGRFTFVGVPAGQFIARVLKIPMPSGVRMSTCGGTGAISYVCSVGAGPSTGPPAVTSEPLLHADQPVTVEARNVANVAITLRRGARVTGHVEFEGTATRPTEAQWNALQVVLERVDGHVFQAQGGYDLTERGRFSADGRFTTPSSWPGRYLLRPANVPAGWSFKAATYQGREISETPFDLTADLDEVTIVFSDRSGKIEGAVQNAEGSPDAAALVLLFPADPAGRIDYGRNSRRVRSVPAVGGKFSLPTPPDGEYCLVAVPDDQAQDWQNPAFLEKAAAVADRLRVTDGQSVTHALRTKRLQ